ALAFRLCLLCLVSPGSASVAPAEAATATLPPGDLSRGRRFFEATGGCTCHTNYPDEGEDAPYLAGGRALATPFGVFYSTNITPDIQTGIGAWSDADFIRAMREGLSPEGEHYRLNKSPDAPFPFSKRLPILGWKWLNFDPQPISTDRARSAEWNRGNYLVNAAAHCGECHTPRTLTGGLDRALWLAGSRDGPEGELAPNITPDQATGIGTWSVVDLVWYLEMGLKPDGDATQGLMAEVIEHGYSKLPEAELRAIAVYLRSIPAIENSVTDQKAESSR
ncbi:MAG: cytochrome c, partial [Deltaproteobacteria bacterium]|nr:cytochrome c [Deltaproteobacteria bacterium]